MWTQVFKHYFEELEEESLRDNFVVVVRGAFLRCRVGFGPVVIAGVDIGGADGCPLLRAV
jgi:hypothetical protein